MTVWLEGTRPPTAPAGERFARLLETRRVIGVPGAHDALSAILAEKAGFECLYLSGGALSASLGLPDLGLMTADELLARTRAITRVVAAPLIVDGDTGYGEALNVMRLIRDLEDADAAAVQIEDQEMPKKCGHLSGKRLVPAEEMAGKIAAARRARRHLRIIARTDAAAHSLDEALRRARLYVEAGADVIFPEALEDDDAFRAFADAIKVPLLANMTEFGRTPHRTLGQFEALGFRLVIWPVSSLRVAAKAVADLYAYIRREGGTEGFLDRMQPRSALYETIGYHAYESLDGSIARSILPETPKGGSGEE